MFMGWKMYCIKSEEEEIEKAKGASKTIIKKKL